MKQNDLKNKIAKISIPGTSDWKKEAKYKIDNKKWLYYSASIALRTLAIIEDDDSKQLVLASKLKVSPQRINKILQGKANLTLKTIGKLSDAIGFELISFPPYKDSYVQFPSPNFDWDNSTKSTDWNEIQMEGGFKIETANGNLQRLYYK